MANVVCDEDKSNPAVCCCICRFPLPKLCAEHLSKHPLDTEFLQHFHLPLSAAQVISSKGVKTQWDLRLFKLHRAHLLLREHCEEILHFADQIEAARHDVVSEFDDYVQSLKQNVKEMQEAFASELQAAIRDTSQHSLEKWTPDGNSLSSLIWHFDVEDPDLLKVFKLWVGKGKPNWAMRVCVESKLPTFSRFNVGVDPLPDEICKRMQIENERLTREIQDLREANAQLESTIATLEVTATDQESKLSDLTASLLSEQSLVQSLREELVKLKSASETKVESLSADVAKLKAEMKRLTAAHQEEMESLESKHSSELEDKSITLQLRKGQSLREECRFRESFDVLERGWRQIPTCAETTAVCVALCEVMGVGLGKFGEAEEIIAQTLKVAEEVDPKSEEVCKLQYAKASLYFHSGRIDELYHLCEKTLNTFKSQELFGDLYWTARLYWVHGKLLDTTDAVTPLDKWAQTPLTKESDVAHLVKDLFRGHSLYARNRVEAEKHLAQVEQLLSRVSRTSIHFAMALFYLCMIYKDDQPDVIKAKMTESYQCFATHFPASFWHGVTLGFTGTIDFHLGEKEAAVGKLEKAATFLRIHFPTHKITFRLTKHVGEVYEALDDFESAKDWCLKAKQAFDSHDPTSSEARENLLRLHALDRKLKERLSNA